MAELQLGLFGAAPAPERPPPCPECNPFGDDQPCECDTLIKPGCAHTRAFICPACADSGDTDGCGFLHRQVCKGRIPLRACRGCGKLRTHGTWNHADWFHCLECVPLGSKKVDAPA